MKQKLKEQKWHHYLLFILLAVIIVFACRKVETTNTQLSTEDKFFSNHYPTNAKTNAILKYVKRQNEQKHFVEKVVANVGYPYWDKALIASNKVKTQRTNSDTTDVFYIPFALPNDSSIKAILVIKTTATDTVHRFISNWQYKNFLIPTDTANKIADKMALLFMALEKNTFSHENFFLKDNALFNEPNRTISDSSKRILKLKTIENTSGRTNLVSTLHICFDISVCGTPEYCKLHGGCDAPNCCCGLCYYDISCDYIDIDSGSGDGGILTGGGSGDSGGGGDSGWTPPADCYSGRTNTPNLPPCEPGWESLGDDETSTTLPLWITDSLQTICFKQALLKISSGSQNTFFKEIYNTFDTSSSLFLNIQEVDSIPGAYAATDTPFHSSLGIYINIDLNKLELKKCSQEFISYNIIHEVAHAAMRANIITWDSTNTQHENMISTYLDKIATSLKAGYSTLTLKDAYSICFFGFKNAIDGNTADPRFLDIMLNQIRAKLNDPNLSAVNLDSMGRNFARTGTKGLRNCN
jgi:hypothetical protein